MLTRALNPEKLRAHLIAQGLTLPRLARLVGTTTLYVAFLLPQSPRSRDALTRICGVLRCHLDDVCDPTTR